MAGEEPTVSYVMPASAHGHAAAAGASPRVQLPLAHKPEVLAPVGGWPQLRAAVENGADAVYFGCEDFNARARWVGGWLLTVGGLQIVTRKPMRAARRLHWVREGVGVAELQAWLGSSWLVGGSATACSWCSQVLALVWVERISGHCALSGPEEDSCTCGGGGSSLYSLICVRTPVWENWGIRCVHLFFLAPHADTLAVPTCTS